jgi:GT2 family glycosyltransferase
MTAVEPEHKSPLSSDTPFVTIVVPTHNRAALLKRLLESFLTQTYPSDRFEVLVVHNRSNDDTEGVVRECAANAPFAIRYFLKDFKGPMPSRQFGMDESSGEVVVFIDDDVIAMPAWLESGVRCLSGDVGLVQGCTIPHPNQPRRMLEKTVEVFQATPYFETCNIFYRKDAIVAVGGFSEEFAHQWAFCGEDTDLGWKVVKAGYGSTFCAEALVYHEVFAVSLKEWLWWPRRLYAWPYLVKKHPEIRDHLYRRYFLDRRTALFNLVVLGIVLALLWHPLALLLCIPYIVVRYIEPTRHRNPLIRTLRLVMGLPRACVFFLALVGGSIWFRSVLL